MTITPLNLGDTRIAAIYRGRANVERAKTIVLKKLGIPERKIEVVAPFDAKTSKNFKGERMTSGHSMWHLHTAFGIFGVIFGLVFALLLVEFGPAFTSQNPTFTFLALLSPGLFVGLFIAGLFSLQPQLNHKNLNVPEQQHADNWALIIDTSNINISKDEIVDQIARTGIVTVIK